MRSVPGKLLIALPAPLKAYQVERARRMYAQTGEDGHRRYTVQQIANELGSAWG